MRTLAPAGPTLARWFAVAAIVSSAAVLPQDAPKLLAGALPVAGGELHYEVRGDGPPIVLLSGGPGFGNYLQPVAEALATSHRCILFDQRGTGASQSEKLDTGSLTLATVVADLEALRVHRKFDRWSMLGHSWGGERAHPARSKTFARW